MMNEGGAQFKGQSSKCLRKDELSEDILKPERLAAM